MSFDIGQMSWSGVQAAMAKARQIIILTATMTEGRQKKKTIMQNEEQKLQFVHSGYAAQFLLEEKK